MYKLQNKVGIVKLSFLHLVLLKKMFFSQNRSPVQICLHQDGLEFGFKESNKNNIYHHVNITTFVSLHFSGSRVERKWIWWGIDLTELKVSMATEVNESVNLQRTSTDITRDTQRTQSSPSTSCTLNWAVGCESDLLTQKMGTPWAETKLPLFLSAQVS